jgi:tetratricopeptide (TPR) repeat protein
MEILKYSFIIGFIFISLITAAQDNNESILKAFSQSYTFENKGDYTNAIKEIVNIYTADSYEHNVRLGWLNYEAGKFTESMAYYEKSLSLKPMSEEAHLGITYPASALGNWNQVLDHYLKILENNPANTSVNYKIGNIYYERKDYTKAYTYFEKVVNLYPFGYDALLMYAWTNFKLNKAREAKVLFNKVLMLSPDDKSALEGLGLLK